MFHHGLEARSPRSSCRQGWAPSEALGGILSPLPRATGGGRALGVCLPLYRSNLCCSGHVTLCLCLLSLLRDAHPSHWAFPGGSVVKNLPAVQKTHEMWLWSPGSRRSHGEENAQPTLVFLPGTVPWTTEPAGQGSMVTSGVVHDWATEHPCLSHCIRARFPHRVTSF